jgi:hypothetical protein
MCVLCLSGISSRDNIKYHGDWWDITHNMIHEYTWPSSKIDPAVGVRRLLCFGDMYRQFLGYMLVAGIIHMCKDHDDLKELPHRLTCFRMDWRDQALIDIPVWWQIWRKVKLICFLKSDHLWCHETWQNNRSLSGGFPEGFFLISHLGAILIQKRTIFVAMYDRIW